MAKQGIPMHQNKLSAFVRGQPEDDRNPRLIRLKADVKRKVKFSKVLRSISPSWNSFPRNILLRKGGGGEDECSQFLAYSLELHPRIYTPFSPFWLIFKHYKRMEGLSPFLNTASQKLIFAFVFPIELWMLMQHSKTVFSRTSVLSTDSNLGHSWLSWVFGCSKWQKKYCLAFLKTMKRQFCFPLVSERLQVQENEVDEQKWKFFIEV